MPTTDPRAHIISEICHLIVKGRIVGENPHGVVIDPNALPHGFHCDGAIPVCDDPMEGRHRKLRAKGGVRQVHPGKIRLGFLHRSALAQQPGNQFKGRYVVIALCQGLIIRIAREI